MIIKKKEALRVLKKFQMPLKGKKERIAIFYYRGLYILRTAVPKGSGDLKCTGKFRKQLYLNEGQLREAIRCPFRKEDFIAHLVEKGKIS